MAPPVQTLTITELAKVFRVTRQTIHDWQKAGCPHRQVNGRPTFDLGDVIAWRRAEDRATASEVVDATKLDKDAEMARKLSAEADLKEMERAERRRQLVDSGLYDERLETFLGGFTAVASGQLSRFERDIVKANDPVAARKVTQAIFAALMEGAQRYADDIERELAQMQEDEAA